MVLHNHWGPLKDPKTGLPFPMEAVGDFCLVDKLFPAVAGDSLVFYEADLTDLKEQDFCIPFYKAENPPPTVKENAHQSHSPEGASKGREHQQQDLGTTLPQNLDSTIPSKSKGKLRHLPQAKEKQEKCDTEGRFSKDKDRFCNEKSNKHGSDKESNSTSSCKWHRSPEQHPLSGEGHAKVPHRDDSLWTPGTGSHQGHLSESEGSMSFVAPVSSSTPYKAGAIPCNCSRSTESRHSMTPLNTGLYSSFTYAAPPSSSFGGGFTPVASISSATESACIVSTVYAPTRVFSPNLQLNSGNLTAEQVTDIYVVPRGFEDDPAVARTFDASGEEVGQL